MERRPAVPPHNLRRYRLQPFFGRRTELAQLTAWLQESPRVAITGRSGIGKSSLATALAHTLMPQFDEGVIWVSACGSDEFHTYDIISAIEDVLATGITSHPPDQWEILALQQLYGRRRLIIVDEIAQSSEDTANEIAEAIARMGPGGPGRVVLVGRHLPLSLVESVGRCHVKLGGLTEADIAEMIAQMFQMAPAASSLQRVMELSEGNPLILRLLLPFLEAATDDPVSSLRDSLAEGWTEHLESVVDFVLDDLESSWPGAVPLMTRLTLSRGGADFPAVQTLYWQGLRTEAELKPTLAELTRRGLLEHDLDEDRYLLHPAVRSLLVTKKLAALPIAEQRSLTLDHAEYYLDLARQYERTPPHQWHQFAPDWANIRQGVETVTQQLETLAGASVQDLLATVDSMSHLEARQPRDLTLVRDYALALRTYCVQRQPPSGFRWLAAGLVAAQTLGDTWSRTLIGARLCTLAYYQGQYDLAETWLQRSLNAFVPIDDRPRMSRVWADLGVLYQAQGRFQEAIAACQQVYSLTEGMGNSRGAGSALMRTGSIHYANDDLQQALDCHQRALALFRKHDDLSGQAMAHNNIGLVYEARNEFAQAIHHYRESARLHEALSNMQGAITAYANLGSASYELGDYEGAIAWYQKDLRLSEKHCDWTGMAATLHNMGHVALEMDDLEAARDYFVRSRDLYAQFGLSDFVAEEEILIQIVRDRRVVRG